MSNEILGDPRKALEEAFFARETRNCGSSCAIWTTPSGRRRRLRRLRASPTMPCSRSWPR